MKIFTTLFLLVFATAANAATLTVGIGDGYDYSTIGAAAGNAQAGDQIVVSTNQYAGGEEISGLSGSEENPIVITAGEGQAPVINGAAIGLTFTDCSYIIVNGIHFQGQTASSIIMNHPPESETNAVSIDITNCTFTGNTNTDTPIIAVLGYTDIDIVNCSIEAQNTGTGIEIIASTYVSINDNSFINMGYGGIIMRAGSEYIAVDRNLFLNAGDYALQIGGKSALEEIPEEADFEAQYVAASSNLFMSCGTAVLFDGSINNAFINNTVYRPENYFFSLKQSTEFMSMQLCGRNMLVNNIFYDEDSSEKGFELVTNEVTEQLPSIQTFIYYNNLWYNTEINDLTRPETAGEALGTILNQDPMLGDFINEDYSIAQESPAVGAGYINEQMYTPVELDFNSNPFSNPPAIGAVEWQDTTSVNDDTMKSTLAMNIMPQPANTSFVVEYPDATEAFDVVIYNLRGEKVWNANAINVSSITVDCQAWAAGVYVLVMRNQNQRAVRLLTIE